MKKVILILSICAAGVSALAQQVQSFDIYPGIVGSNPTALTTFRDKLCFYGNDVDGSGLMMYNEASGIVQMVARRKGNPATFSGNSCAVVGDKIYFCCDMDGAHGDELYAWDGVNAAAMVADIRPGAGSSNPQHLMACNGKLYFIANSGDTSGTGFYMYDGTTPPRRVPGLPGGGIETLWNSVIWNNKIYFVCYWSGVTGIWRNFMLETHSDFITEPLSIQGSNIDKWAVNGSDLYFTDGTGSIYSYGGKTAPTRIVSTATHHLTGVSRTEIASLNGRLYFGATYDTSARAYFACFDPVSAKVTNIAPLYVNNGSGSKAEGVGEMEIFKNRLYLSGVLDTGRGVQLYRYDGATISVVADSSQGGGGSYLTPYNGALYWESLDAKIGRELSRLTDNVGIAAAAWSGSASVYPNPLMGQSAVQLRLQESQILTITLVDLSGRKIWSTGPRLFEKGNSRIDIPAQQLAAGTYFLQITDGAAQPVYSSKVLKL